MSFHLIPSRRIRSVDRERNGSRAASGRRKFHQLSTQPRARSYFHQPQLLAAGLKKNVWIYGQAFIFDIVPQSLVISPICTNFRTWFQVLRPVEKPEDRLSFEKPNPFVQGKDEEQVSVPLPDVTGRCWLFSM